MSTAKVIGRAAATLVRHELTRSGAAPPARRSVLVRNLARDEVAEMVSTLNGLTVDEGSKPIEIVVSLGPEHENDPELEAYSAGGKSMTYFRSRVSSGLVLVEVDPFSDSSGQRHLRAVTDSEILGGSTQTRRHQALLAEAWTSIGHGSGGPPAVLTERLDRLVRAYARIDGTLRRWTSFLIDLLARVPTNEVLTPERAATAIGDALPTLGMFRDPTLFEHRDLQRELERNRHIAQMRTPQGRELEQEDLLGRVDSAEWSGPDENPDDAERAARRSAASAYVLAPTISTRAAAPLYRDWLPIFEATGKRGLGEQVRSALVDLGNEIALERFNELQVQADLDVKDQEAAQKLRDDDVDVGDERTLLELLPTTLRRRVERLATPGVQRVEEPMRGILQAVVAVAGDDATPIEVTLAEGPVPEGTRSVFALLYGPTLAGIADDCGDQFQLAEELRRIAPPPTEDDVDEDGQPAEMWADLGLVVRSQDGDTAANLAWAPPNPAALALLARIVEAGGDASWPLRGETFSDLAEGARGSRLPAPPDNADTPPEIEGWTRRREAFLKQCSIEGLDLEKLLAYCRAWTAAASEMTAAIDAAPELRGRVLPTFLNYDLAVIGDGVQVWMMATHPLRLRWLALDLHHLSNYLRDAIRGNLRLNPENSKLFFDWLGRVSPHRQPPMLVFGSKSYLPAQEQALHEEYVRTEVERESVGEQMDVGTFSELAGVIDSFLDAFPAKTDRFVLLLFTRVGDVRLVERLVQRLMIDRSSARPDQALELHVVTPAEHHAALATAIAELPVEDSSAGLLPRLRTVLHGWPSAEDHSLTGIEADIDIAIVPEVLGSRSTLNDGTGQRPNGRDFDPWLDKPVNVPLRARHRTDVNMELLPAERDDALELWSTLNVRRRRQPVGTAPGDVDQVSLAVEVSQGLRLFQRLHELSQWVVTVDEFVGREQIDAIDDPPDVILVRPGTGKNELYTLVVSSKAGRSLVESGLRRKLARLDLGLTPVETEGLSQRLYDLARNTAPSVVLRAIGLGRTLEEILGLVTTRVLVGDELPSPGGRGADWWISLDDHTSWFGGALKPRADLARVAVREDANGVSLCVDIIEAKFRQAEATEQAVRQVKRTMRILGAGLDPLDERADSRFWREELVRATDGISRRERPVEDLPGFSIVGDCSEQDLDRLRDALVEGNYQLKLGGIACSIAVAVQGELSRSEVDDVQVLRAPKEATARVLRTTAGQGEERPGQTAENGVPVVDEPLQVQESVPGDETSAQPRDDLSGPELSGYDADGRISNAELVRRLQQVVDKLDEFGIAVNMPSEDAFDEGPGFYVLRVLPGRGVKVQQVEGRSDDLRLALDLGAEQELRMFTDRGTLVIEVPKSEDERYAVGAAGLWGRVPIDDHRLLVPVGENIAGDPVILDFSSPDTPHLLIGGMTGSGKSVALRTILEGLCRYPAGHLQILAVDPKRTELNFLRDKPQLLGALGHEPSDAVGFMDRAREEMERRYALMGPALANNIEDYNRANSDGALPWWLLVLDEYADLTIDPHMRREIEPRMLQLAQKARAAGIHVVLATQRPSADILNPTVRANFGAQLALRVRSLADSMIIIGEAGAEALAGKGDALLRTSRGTIRVQCAIVDA